MIKVTSNEPNTVSVSWYFTTVCNFACSYCPTELHDGKFGFPDYENALEFIKKIAENTDKVFLELVGGEPTLWPKLIDFLKEVQTYSNVTSMILTNGSRTNNWWKKYCNADLDLKTLFVFSFHNEQCDRDLFYSNLEIISEKHNVVAMLLLDPKRFDYTKELGDRIQKNLPVDVVYKPIRKQMHNIDLLDGYTDNMYKLINRTHKENLYDRKKYKKESDKIIFPTKIYIDNELTNWQTVILEKRHAFKGWKCAAGSKRFCIDFNGDVLTCSEARHFSKEIKNNYLLGNINKNNVNILKDYVTCPVDFCPCKMDALTEKHNG